MNKLVKVSHNKQIFGVCEGLGRYFNVDSTFVRIGFALSTLLGFGIALPVYLILALVMPNDYDIDTW